MVRESQSCFIKIIVFAEVKITGKYQNLQLGNITTINCSVPQLMNSVINWLSLDGSVVSSSGALILQSVNYTINGIMFVCFVQSPYLTHNYNETITVTVQSELTIEVYSLSLNIYLCSNIS